MELSHSLLLNETALKQTPDPNRPVFFYEWLKYLERILPHTQKADIRNSQKQLIEQLTQRISTGPGPTTRALLAKCIAQVFLIADSYDLFQTINLCNDLLKSKDDSNAQIQIKLTALAILGAMYEQLGKMVSRSYEDSFDIMSKWIKSAESISRAEILITLSKMVHGLGASAYSRHRDIFKMISKNSLTDRVMFVRVAAVKCLHDLCSEHGSPIYPLDVDAIMNMLLKSMDKSNNEVRVEIAKVFGKIAGYAVNNKEQKPVATNQQQNQPTKTVTLDVVLKFMSEAFLRGGIGGFLKGGTSAGGYKEIRIGIALAYVEVARELGSKWLERNLSFWQKHLFELAYNIGPIFVPDTLHLGIDARHCISFVFRQTLGQMLSENSQINACKNFGVLINESLEKMVVSNEDTNDRIMVDDGISASCTVALLEISALVRQVDSSIAPLFVEANGIQETVFECVTHPAQMVRLAAAWCLRCVIRSVPTQATPLINLCFIRLKNDRKTSLAIAGYSIALAALTAGSQQTELGIPFQKTHDVFDIGKEMVMTAQDRMKLALSKSQHGWLLITSVLSMGGSYVRRNLRHLLPIWRCSFPRSVEEAKAEIQRGDAFTWECSLRSRAGAFASMEAFIVHAGELLNEELLKQIVQLVEITLHTLSVLASNNLLRTQPVLRTPVHLLRIRLYALLNRIPFKYYEGLFRILLSELVADITLSDNPQLTTTCSQLASMCTAVGDCLLGGWSVTQNELEVQLHSPQCESRALEYDPNCVIIGATTWAQAQQLDADDPSWPQPLPSQVASVNAAVQTFGRIYPLLVTKHKIQLTDHFTKCLNDPKQQNTARFQAVEMNVLGAMLCAMRSMGDYRHSRIEDEDLRRKTVQLLREYVCSERPLLKCLAVECLGRLAQAIAEPQFVAARTVEIFEDLRVKQDEKSRTGLALALGTLYRYKGSLGSEQHFKKAVGDLLTFAQINASPTVQAWAILSLSLIASTGGGMFREYVKPSLEFCLRQLLNTPSNNVEVVQCIGKLISALITSVGPELAAVPTTPSGSNIEDIRQSCLATASMMFAHGDAQVRAEAIACQQQLHLFAPRYVELDRLVASLCDLLYSPHQILRRATIQCLKQLLQREAREVREHAQNLLPAGVIDRLKKSPLPETGLEGSLFELLDMESDVDQRQNIKDCLLFLVQATSDEHLNFWLSVCKDILASSTTTNSESILRSTLVIQDQKPSTNESSQSGTSQQDSTRADEEEDDDALQSVHLGESRARDKVTPRWPTRVFAFTIVRKLMSLCDTERAHLDPALAKEIQMSSNGRADYLVFHLADLVRMSFMGATSENSSLRLAGLACLQDIIDRFAEVPEPEIQEPHVILEQFQAQVSAALGPAFDAETPSHVTAAACQVCSAWICSGVARNLNDLRRVNQLLVSSLEKLKDNSMNAQLYNESAATLEKLSILKAWAEVYVVALKRQEPVQMAAAWPGSTPQTPAVQHMEFDYSTNSTALLDLVNPELSSLVGHWLSALRDAAMLSLSSEFELPQNGGAFYTVESADSCREYYNAAASSLLLAASMWLRQNNFATALFNQSFGGRKQSTEELQADATAIASKWTDQERCQHFNLILAMCVESLCTANRSASGDDRLIHTSLDTLSNLIDCLWSQFQLMSDVRLPIEIMNVLHRLILTNDNLQVQRHCADVVQSLLNAACVALKAVANEKNFDNGNLPEALRKSAPTSFDGFDSESGRIHAQSSLVFATLEVCLCLLVRQIPQVNPGKSNPIAPLHFRKYGRLSDESNELIKRAIALLTRISSLCTPKGSIVVLPSMMFLILGVFKESSRVEADTQRDLARSHITDGAQAAIKAIRAIVSRPPVDETFEQWASIVRSSLLSLLKMAEDNEERGPVDEAVVMVAACVMLTNMPPRLYIGAVLFQKVCALIRRCLDSPNFDVQFKALQTVNSLFSRREMAAAYVKELGTNVFAKLRPYVMPVDGESEDKQRVVTETDLPVLSGLSDSELLTIQETIKAVEAVLAMAKGEKEFAFVNLLTRCLARFLCPDPEKQLNTVEENVRRLHDFAYQRLNLIGPAHPEPFSRLIKNSAPLRRRIESAAQIIAKQQQQEKHNQMLQHQKALAAKQQALKAAQQKPAIDLKTFAELPPKPDDDF